MLTTPKETLIAITEKEEMEFKMQQVQNIKKSSQKPNLIERDHLPFAKLKLKIASEMPDAPKMPVFKINLTFE